MKDPYATEKNKDQLTREEGILRPFVSERRWTRMLDVLSRRSRYITVAVEDLFQPHNGSAVLRSCDAFGVQDVHIIENRNRYRVNPGVELGTAQWLSLYRYREETFHTGARPAATPTTTLDQSPQPAGMSALGGTYEAITTLRNRGYRIVATTPHRDDVTPDSLSLDDGPVAVFFGAEKEGLSDAVLAAADEYMRIPMHGFVESLNISVSAAICLHRLGERLRSSNIAWPLTEDDRRQILNRWLRSSVRNAPLILEREL